MLIDIKMKKICNGIGQNGRLKIYVDPKKNYVDPGIKPIFSKMVRYIWLKFCMEY